MKRLKKFLSKTIFSLTWWQFKFFQFRWEFLVYLISFFVAFILNRVIETFILIVAFNVIRPAFHLTFHHKEFLKCIMWSTIMFSLCIFELLLFPLSITIVGGILVAFIDCLILYYVQSFIDKTIQIEDLENFTTKLVKELETYKNINLYQMKEEELRIFGSSKGLSIVQQDILVHRIIENLKISEICAYRNYGRTTIKYHLAEIKRKLNINTI